MTVNSEPRRHNYNVTTTLFMTLTVNSEPRKCHNCYVTTTLFMAVNSVLPFRYAVCVLIMAKRLILCVTLPHNLMCSHGKLLFELRLCEYAHYHAYALFSVSTVSCDPLSFSRAIQCFLWSCVTMSAMDHVRQDKTMPWIKLLVTMSHKWLVTTAVRQIFCLPRENWPAL